MAYKLSNSELLNAIDLTATYYPNPQPNLYGTLRLTGKYVASNVIEIPRFKRTHRTDDLEGIYYEVCGRILDLPLEHTDNLPEHDTGINFNGFPNPPTSVKITTSTGEKTVEIKFEESHANPLKESDASTVFQDVHIDKIQADKPISTTSPWPVPLYASDLTAKYYKGDHILRMKGNWWFTSPVQQAVFHRRDFEGGIGYEVEGIIKGSTEGEELCYGEIKYEDLHIRLPNLSTPSNTVVFFTRGGDKVVNIEHIEGNAPIEKQNVSFTQSGLDSIGPVIPTKHSFLDAENLGATYETFWGGTGKLTLSGDYTSEGIVYNPCFVPMVSLLPGLMFGVVGDVSILDPIKTKGKLPDYITLENLEPWESNVIIVTKSGLKNVSIIRVGLPPASGTNGIARK